jgi:formylglycine-generating enzyme required for sulfatase activity
VTNVTLRTTFGLLALLLFCVGAHAADANAPFKDCPDCPEMQRVPAGTFVMGTPGAVPSTDGRAESQATIVRIAKPFALGRTEVTRREFRAFLRESSYEQKGDCVLWDAEQQRFTLDRSASATQKSEAEVTDDMPATCISWQDARAYAQWLAKKTGKPYRMPSEAEWEYSARAGSVTLWPWGDTAAEGCDFANTYDLSGRELASLGWEPVRCRDGYAGVAPTGALRPNAFGLYDLIGNVSEWVEDCYTDSYVGRPKDGRAWYWNGGCRKHVIRGGSWASAPEQTRSAYRSAADAATRLETLGLRVALDLDGRTEAH